MQGGIEDDRMQGVFAGALGGRLRERDDARGFAGAGEQFARGPEFRAVTQTAVAFVFVMFVDVRGLESAGARFPTGGFERRFNALATEGSDDMHGPCGRRFEAALDGERALGRVVGQFHDEARGIVGKDERLADFEVLDGERATLEIFHSGLECHLDEAGGGENDVVVDAMVAQVGQVTFVKVSDPCGLRAGQADVEQSAPAGREPAVAHVGRLVPPAFLLPRIGGKREQFARGRHGREIDGDAEPVKVERRFHGGFLLALAPGGRHHGRLLAGFREAFLDRDRQRRMAADFEPHIDVLGRHRLDRGDELHGLADARAPVGGGAILAGAAFAGHGAEERDRLLARAQIRKRGGERVGRRLHQRVVERVLHAHEAVENLALLEFGRHRLERRPEPGDREGFRSVERCDARLRVVPRDEVACRLLVESHGEHGPREACAPGHHLRADHDDARGLFEGEDAGHAGRREFAHAVSGDGRGCDAAGFPQFAQGELHGENRRLPDFRLGQTRRLFVLGQFLQQREVRIRLHRLGACFHRLAEDFLGRHQFAPHAPPLRTLTAHHESDARGVFGVRGE